MKSQASLDCGEPKLAWRLVLFGRERVYLDGYVPAVHMCIQEV